MYTTTATCAECNGDAQVRHPFLPGPVIPPLVDCTHCGATGECDCEDCLNTASENAFSDMCESEPPLSADERHQMAWREKQELRR